MAEKNPLVRIAGVTAGTSVAIVAVVCVLARQQLWAGAAAVAALALMAMVLGFFATKRP